MKVILLLVVTFFLHSCAIYTVEYQVEAVDQEGNVVSRHVARGKAFVANSSDEVVFRLDRSSEDWEIEFGKTNTGAEAQVEIIDMVADKLVCISNPATCVIP